jgi:hypothetical protein
MTELTLGDIKNYLKTVRGTPSNDQPQSLCKEKVIRTTFTIQEADNFLLTQINAYNTYNTSSTTKDNFLELYNEHYSRNMEAFVGILIVSAILAKMMFYPTKV